MKTAVHNLAGQKVGELELPENIFGLKWNSGLVHQVILAMRANRRKGTAHAKGRGEVSGGGKKPWRQKGTGRARHGSIRSPLWVGGGVTHGPVKEKIYAQKINQKAKKKAFFMALGRKLSDGELLVLDKVVLDEAKTQKAKEALKRLSGVKGFEALAQKGSKLAVSAHDPKTKMAFRNLPGVKIIEAQNLNALEAMSTKYLILEEKDVMNLSKKGE